MAADESRAVRIRELKADHPGVRWREIAAYVGVSERSTHAWRATGAIAYDNAAKLTEFFRQLGADIDEDYIWRGTAPETPNLLGVLDGESQLDRVEQKLDDVLSRLAALEPLPDLLADLQESVAQGRREDAAHDMEVLRRIEEALRVQRRRPRPGQQ